MTLVNLMLNIINYHTMYANLSIKSNTKIIKTKSFQTQSNKYIKLKTINALNVSNSHMISYHKKPNQYYSSKKTKGQVPSSQKK